MSTYRITNEADYPRAFENIESYLMKKITTLAIEVSEILYNHFVEALREFLKYNKFKIHIIEPGGNRILICTGAGSLLVGAIAGVRFGLPGVISGIVLGSLLGYGASHISINVKKISDSEPSKDNNF